MRARIGRKNEKKKKITLPFEYSHASTVIMLDARTSTSTDCAFVFADAYSAHNAHVYLRRRRRPGAVRGRGEDPYRGTLQQHAPGVHARYIII